MNREQLKEKYHDTLHEMYEREGGDADECLDRLIAMARVHAGIELEGMEKPYYVPEGFDYDTILEEYDKLED